MSEVETHDGQHNDERPVGVLVSVSNAMVRLHKEQFGRGPTKVRSNFAGRDTLVSVLENTLLPAELALVEMGQQDRVQESRLFFQTAHRVNRSCRSPRRSPHRDPWRWKRR